MKTTARKTGLSPHVIRVWEKRYGAVEPGRTNTNRRLYSDTEVARLCLLHEATRAGYTIGTIARLDSDQLRILVGTSNLPGAGQPSEGKPEPTSTAAPSTAEFLQLSIAAIKRMDAQELEDHLRHGSLRLGSQGVLQKLVAPLVQQLGDLWRSGEVSAAQEHFATHVIRQFLGNLTRPYAAPDSAPNLVVATPAGQLHELGAVLVAAGAAAHGWRVTYLGASLPAVDIASSVIKSGGRAVALSLVYPADDPRLPGEIHALRDFLPESVAVIAGGRAAPAYHNALKQIGAQVASSLDDLYRILDGLRDARLADRPA